MKSHSKLVQHLHPLLPPFTPEWSHSHRQRHRGGLPPTQDPLDDLRRQQRQPKDATDVGFVRLLIAPRSSSTQPYIFRSSHDPWTSG
jgi:hypothetical protein